MKKTKIIQNENMNSCFLKYDEDSIITFFIFIILRNYNIF